MDNNGYHVVGPFAPRTDHWANARLIAAAPELLAALQIMVNAYQQHFEVMPVAWQSFDEMARAAIAKAEGGQT